jgi:hypothetical protein
MKSFLRENIRQTVQHSCAKLSICTRPSSIFRAYFCGKKKLEMQSKIAFMCHEQDYKTNEK